MGVPTKYCTSRSKRASKKDLTNLLPEGASARPKLSLLHANEFGEENKVILVGVRNGTRLVNTGRRSACWQGRQIKDLRKTSDSRQIPGRARTTPSRVRTWGGNLPSARAQRVGPRSRESIFNL